MATSLGKDWPLAGPSLSGLSRSLFIFLYVLLLFEWSHDVEDGLFVTELYWTL